MDNGTYDSGLAVGELHVSREPEQRSLNEITALLYYINGIAEGLSGSETLAEIRHEFAYSKERREEVVNDKEARERIIGKLASQGDLKRITRTKGRYLSNQRDGAVKVKRIRKESPFLLEIIGPIELVFIVLYLGSGIKYEYKEIETEDGNSRVERRFEFNPPDLSHALEALRKLF
ncbi:hypothetical protein [Natrononativus amylolyticus]|uniref:hypothetical protein n=1 Tax=Natrononativus amylolyticus TaxID=2963434 RepID=UPI0020CCF07B|nr:hypothetical protein [Natrononativus amylolyticus]